VNVTAYQAMYGRAFVFARSDWEYVFNTFAFCYAIGYHFITSDTGSMNGNFLGLGADAAFNASVQVDGAQNMGLLITNGEFTCFGSGGPWCPACKQINRQVVINPSCGGPVRFVNTAFWGPSQQIALHQGPSTLGFSDCTFVTWSAQLPNTTVPAITATNGNLLVRGCEFAQDGEQIEMGDKVRKAIITDNLIKGKQRIKFTPRPTIVVANNVPDS